MLSKGSSRFNLGLTGVWTGTHWSWTGTYNLHVFVPGKVFLLGFFNIWSINDETTKNDKAPKTLDELKRRLHFEWKSVTLDTLNELANYMPRRLKKKKKKK